MRVYYEDTDAGGVVYHSNYLNFMERARTEWLRHLGFEQTQIKDAFGVIIVIHSLSITFKSPARFDDLLAVNCVLAAFGRSSMDIKQKITCNGALIAEADVKGLFINAVNFKPASIPNNIKQVMESL